MTNDEARAVAYLKTAFGKRDIHVNPKGHEPGFYHQIFPYLGRPYFAKIASLSDPRFTGGVVAIIDHTGDADRILKHLD